MKNKRLDKILIMAEKAITCGQPFLLEGKLFMAQPQQNPTIQPCQECRISIRCDIATSVLCEFADFVHAQSCILVDA